MFHFKRLETVQISWGRYPDDHKKYAFDLCPQTKAPKTWVASNQCKNGEWVWNGHLWKESSTASSNKPKQHSKAETLKKKKKKYSGHCYVSSFPRWTCYVFHIVTPQMPQYVEQLHPANWITAALSTRSAPFLVLFSLSKFPSQTDLAPVTSLLFQVFYTHLLHI